MPARRGETGAVSRRRCGRRRARIAGIEAEQGLGLFAENVSPTYAADARIQATRPCIQTIRFWHARRAGKRDGL